MNSIAKAILVLTLSAPALLTRPASGMQDAAAPAAARKASLVGAVTAIQGNTLTIKTDAGVEAVVNVSDSTRLLQSQPGQKDLGAATAIHIADIEVGDRVLARGTLGDDGKTYAATTLVAMKHADLAQKHQQDIQDWQRSGEGGLVKSVDPAAQTVTISITGAGAAKTVLVRTTPTTILRRYAAGSIEFNDAQAAPFDRIKAGDQLRARGTRSADGSELQAAEIVSGTFRNVVATVTFVDTASGTITARDLVAKAPVTIKVTSDSQLRKLPPMMAQMMAMRLRSGAGGPGPGQGGQSSGNWGSGARTAGPGSGGPASGADKSSAGAGPASGPDSSSGDHAAANSGSGQASWQGQGAAGGEQRPRGAGDLQQALSRAPEIKLSDLQKGDAVMVVTTEGSSSTPGTVVTLLAGVEPMLQASASGTQSMLSSWNLGGGGDPTAGSGGGGASPQQ